MLAGYPVVDVKVRALRRQVPRRRLVRRGVPGRRGARAPGGAAAGQPVLLEPIVKLQVTVPSDALGDVIGDINAAAAASAAPTASTTSTIVDAYVPLANMLDYEPKLTSITSGRGTLHAVLRPLRLLLAPHDREGHQGERLQARGGRGLKLPRRRAVPPCMRWWTTVKAAACVLGVVGAGCSAAPEDAVPSYPHRAVCAEVPGRMHCHAHIRTDAAGNAVRTASPGGLAPSDLRSAYDLPATGGVGRTIAIVDAYDDPTAESDSRSTARSTGCRRAPPRTAASGRSTSGARPARFPPGTRAGAPRFGRPRHGQRRLPELQPPPRRGRRSVDHRSSAPR